MSLFSNMSIKDQTLFAKRLSFLVRSHVPILEGLRMLRDQAVGASKKKMLTSIMDDVSSGKYLSTSLARYRNSFGDFAINIIRVGETGGILDENLSYLAEELKKKQLLRRKVISSLIYPILIITATMGITGLLTVYIFPKILPIFASLNVKLPLATRILIVISDFLRNYGLYLAGGILLALTALAWLTIKKQSVHLFVDKAVLKVPLLGAISLNYSMANMCRTLGLLLKSNVKLVESINITADTMGSTIYRKHLAEMAVGVGRGERISKNLEKHPQYFPSILTQMISIGEVTGKLSETLLYLSELYENEVDELTKNLSSAIEPLLMIVMGVAVGFIAVSIITPIYQVTQNLHP